MNILSVITILVFITSFSKAQEGVSDPKKNEEPKALQILSNKKSMRFYLSNMPQTQWNKELNKYDALTWKKIDGFYASFRLLGHVRGRRLYELRYVTNKRIDQGLDQANIIVILAKEFDNKPDENLLFPIYYREDDHSAVYNYIAKYIPEANKFGAIKITTYYTGNGGHRNVDYIRGTEEFGYETFTPKQKKDNKSQ